MLWQRCVRVVMLWAIHQRGMLRACCMALQTHISGPFKPSLPVVLNALFTRSEFTRRAALSGNAEFATELMRWAFRQRGVLRASGLRHRHAGAAPGSAQPSWYRVTDVLAVEVDIHELVYGAWVPYKCVPPPRLFPP